MRQHETVLANKRHHEKHETLQDVMDAMGLHEPA